MPQIPFQADRHRVELILVPVHRFVVDDLVLINGDVPLFLREKRAEQQPFPVFGPGKGMVLYNG